MTERKSLKRAYLALALIAVLGLGLALLIADGVISTVLSYASGVALIGAIVTRLVIVVDVTRNGLKRKRSTDN
ncbi:hypothetical protein PUV54_13220 [Hyphococcus flavus]|uniref:Uncharacterized protein n=1 Tax=Hyphococcus flavus TaxID=1866326 RepID=A0AAF0CF17_9PROT|nr:hypothetical protein [Hyphococcus flavus]WDI30914.1 hypothetical protein PUV54_13220 [Hyphococcus flavus]